MSSKINKSKLNLSIDIIMFIVLMIIAGLGFLIKYVLVPGFKRNQIYGRDVELYFGGLDRHQWGSIHLIFSFILLFLLLLHIIFHWQQIVSIFKRMVPSKVLRLMLTIIFVMLSVLFAIVPLFIKPAVEEGSSHSLHLNSSSGKQHGDNQKGLKDTLTQKTATYQQEPKHSHKESHSVEVYGYMSLNEVADMYHIPVADLAAVIKVPKDTYGEQLGRLRKRYGFQMDDLRLYIEMKKQ